MLIYLNDKKFNIMILEDYSTAIYWRIAAIFFAIAALFSAGTILWYLIFRENPNMPDETDSSERLRFEEELRKEKHNLISEIVGAFRNIPSIGFNNNCDKQNEISFWQRFCLLMGSSSSKNAKTRIPKCESQIVNFKQPLSNFTISF